MSQTEEKKVSRSARLSAAFFDEVLVPLAKARAAADATPYFPSFRDEKVETYFERTGLGPMSESDFEFPGGGTPEGLIAALTAFWRAEGDAALSASALRLVAIADALREEAVAQDGSVDPLCYTLF